jgi:hypothetical protein
MRKIIQGAEARDAPLGGELLVLGFVQRDLADRGEERLLLRAGEEIFGVDQPVRESRLEQIVQLAAFSRMVTNSSAPVG